MREASSEHRTSRLQEKILEQLKRAAPQPCHQPVPPTTPTLIAIICHASARITDITHHIVSEEATPRARRALTRVVARIAHITTARIFPRRHRCHQHVLHSTSAARPGARTPSATRTTARRLRRSTGSTRGGPSVATTAARGCRPLGRRLRRLRRLRGVEERGVEARGQEELVLVQLPEAV